MSRILGARSSPAALWSDYICVNVLRCALACAVVPASYSPAAVLTSQYQSLNVLDGEYRINNNVWGASTTQWVEAFSNDTYFQVTRSDHDQGSVASYPFIQKGVHWGGANTTGSNMPIQVADVGSAPFTWNVDTVNVGGSWNAAFEAWFSTSGGIPPDAAELMIWVDYQGVAFPGGSFIENVSIGGLTWRLSFSGNWGSWDNYIAYQLLTPTSEVSLDLKDFMDDSLARGYLDPAWYLDNMEAGFEIWSDGEGLTTSSFSAEVIAGLPGDFNKDGSVDAADYTVWRHGLGAAYIEADYDVWKANFGRTADNRSSASVTVPEPVSVLLMLAAIAVFELRGCATHQVPFTC